VISARAIRAVNDSFNFEETTDAEGRLLDGSKNSSVLSEVDLGSLEPSPSIAEGDASVVGAESLARAVDLLIAGAWQEAHEIVQDENSALAAWLHGIVHTLEGDLDNARYWYRRAGRVFPGPDAVQEELAAARRTVQAMMTRHER
jgi:hypothetical protein